MQAHEPACTLEHSSCILEHSACMHLSCNVLYWFRIGQTLQLRVSYRGQTLQLRGMYRRETLQVRVSLSWHIKVNFNFVRWQTLTMTDKATLWIIELLTSQLKSIFHYGWLINDNFIIFLFFLIQTLPWCFNIYCVVWMSNYILYLQKNIVYFTTRNLGNVTSLPFPTKYFCIPSRHLSDNRISSTSWQVIWAIIWSPTAAVIHFTSGWFA